MSKFQCRARASCARQALPARDFQPVDHALASDMVTVKESSVVIGAHHFDEAQRQIAGSDEFDHRGEFIIIDPAHQHRVQFDAVKPSVRSEEHTSELQSLMRISYAVFCLKKKQKHYATSTTH